jgi:hypothetical protein
MGLIGKRWRLLPPRDRRTLWSAALLLAAARVGLWLLPLGAVRRLLARVARALHLPRRAAPTSDRVIWAIATARRAVPAVTCLAQALAGEALLRDAGCRVDLWIGVAKTPAGRLTGHAWIESDGRIILGDLHELSDYTRLPPLPSPLP